MEIIRTNSLSPSQKQQIFRLWNMEYPVQLNFPALSDFENYLRVLSNPMHYLALDSDSILGWAFAFTRENERWFAIIIDSGIQNNGLGTKMLHALKKDELMLNAWMTDHNNYKKADGSIYLSPKSFYTKNDFTFCETRLETEKLSAVKIKWQLKK